VEENENRHAANVAEVFFPYAYATEYVVCTGDRDMRCSAGVECKEMDWMHHSDFGGLRMSQSLSLLAGGEEGERMRKVQLRQSIKSN
jgi:hypothetical protein